MTEICNESSIRLVGGQSEREGTVEVCQNGAWGPICSNQWNAPDAAVVCRQLGHSFDGEPALLTGHVNNSCLCAHMNKFKRQCFSQHTYKLYLS